MSNSTPSIKELYEAFSVLLETTGQSGEERNKAIARAESLHLQIQKDSQWQELLNYSDQAPIVAQDALRYRYILDCAHGDGYPSAVFDCLTGGAGHLDDVIDQAIEESQNTSAPAP